MSDLPFTFAWVNETQTVFDPDTMAVFDEEILAFDVSHEEGQVPTLDIIVRNPRIGLLNPGRKLWVWLGYTTPSGIVPLFFGVLVGVPTSLFKEKVTLKFLARSPDFIANKQALAETMKSAPYYDPVWLDISKRDDPDSILEGWSALWHIDRKSLEITASDILSGEDGTLLFNEGQVPYDSVSLQLDQPPLSNIRVEASVQWTQRTSGIFDVPDVSISSYTGESLLSGWPKPGSGVGAGYKVDYSFVTDTYRVSQTPNATYSSTWNNSDPNPGQCGNASASTSSSGPALLSPDPLTCILTAYSQSGVCDPFSDPPTNTPLQATSSGIIVPQWNVTMSMSLRYDASRQFSEILSFDMLANTQGILASPTVSQNTELLTLSGSDVGQPLVEVDAWTDFAGEAVALAQIVFANNPTTPGGLAYQICVQAGIAGEDEPIFSDIPGEETIDGTVVWSSMGLNAITTAPAWSPASYANRGQIILMKDTTFNPVTGSFDDKPGAASYYICTTAGQTNDNYRIFTYLPLPTSNVEPTPALRHISHIDPPEYSTNIGSTIRDGSVVWTVLGQAPAMLGIPIGGTITNVTARSYFPTARGLRSVEYLISRARARLRMRARAVKVGWTAPFDLGVGLSCRKNATLLDPRFPGGSASGKVTRYKLSAHGDGKLLCQVEIGCSIGFGESVVTIPGDPVYAADGYMEPGYQVYEGETFAHGNDTTYTKPIFTPFDDGLKFPLRWEDVSDGGLVSGTLAEQKAAIITSFDTARELQYLNTFGGSVSIGLSTSKQSGKTPDQAWKLEREQLALASQNTPYVMQANPISWSALIKPCSGNGPFGGSYAITVSPLTVPQGINLEAPSQSEGGDVQGILFSTEARDIVDFRGTALPLPIMIEAAMHLGFDLTTATEGNVSISAHMNVGFDEAVATNKTQMLVANMNLGFDQAASNIRRDRMLTVAPMSLGFDEAATIVGNVSIEANMNLGFDEAAALKRDHMLSAAMDFGFTEAAAISRAKLIAANMSLGFNEAAAISRSRALAASMALGFNDTITLTKSSPPTVIDSGSGNVTVPTYNTLTLELWGGGATGGVAAEGVNGNDTTVSTYSLTAGGGKKATATTVNNDVAGAGIGGTATGGNTTNTNGGVAGLPSGHTIAAGNSGKGGDAPNGGLGGAAAFGNVFGSANPTPGNAGAAPGGGGSGDVVGQPAGDWGSYKRPGGGSGSYVKHVFVFGVTVGAPTPGDTFAYAIAAAVTATSQGTGAAGRLKITVT